MKTSVEWLKEFADIDVSPKELGDILTMTGSKVETIESKGNDIKNVVVGKILEIKKHPDADKLVITKVDVGEEILQIVTGANNIKENDIVPIAKDGSELPGGVKIKTGKLRGIESCGMMCSVGELGLELEDYPGQIEHGIMILPASLEKDLGKDIVEVLQLKEDIIDFEITPNRPDCLSVEGLGRETAISLGKEFKNPRSNLSKMQIETKPEIKGLTVDITAPDLCYRYVARMVENVKIQESPEWLKRRLKACGVRAINNIVDITNYVMLEMGQPMHAFDIESIKGKHITVRRAKQGETITTLDDEERILDETMLVIADDEKPVAIAGVMGGLNSEIEKDTQTVVFESAVFYGGSIRKTAKKVGLRTEASSRYEKGLSPENAERVVNRAVELVELLKAGKAVEGKIDVYPTKQKKTVIPWSAERINDLLGIQASKQEMIDIFTKLEIQVEGDTAIPPYFRQDIEQEADLAEEVLRFYGYDTLPSTLIEAESTLGSKNKQQKIVDTIQEVLVNSGFSEIYTYGFYSAKDMKKALMDENSDLVRKTIFLQNPLSDDFDRMRTTTIPSMMQTLETNYNKKNMEVKLYELGRSYINEKEAIQKGELPQENNMLTLGAYGENVDFYYIKGIIENILQAVGVNRYDFLREEENHFYHPGRTAKLKVGNDIFAYIGEAHPSLTEQYGITKKVYLVELNIDKITRYAKQNKKYVEVPKFPAALRDIAMVVAEEVEVGTIQKIMEKKAKKILERVTLFDVYRSEKLGENKKSVAFELTFRIPERTLTDEEVNKAMQDIITGLEQEVGANLRK